MTGVSELVEQECCMEMLVDDMDISRLMMFAQKLGEFKIRKEKKRIRMDKEGPMDIVVLKIDKSFPDKVILVILSISMKMYLILYLKGRMIISTFFP